MTGHGGLAFHFGEWEREYQVWQNAQPPQELARRVRETEVVESARTFSPTAPEVEPAGDDEWVADEPKRAPLWATLLVLGTLVALCWGLLFGAVALIAWAIRDGHAIVLATFAGGVVGYVVTRWAIRRYRTRRAVIRAGMKAWEARS